MKNLIIFLSTFMIFTANSWATQSVDADFPAEAIICGNTGGNNPKHKAWWCHIPPGNPTIEDKKPQCLDYASINGDGNNDHTSHIDTGDHFATSDEVNADSCGTGNVVDIELGGYQDGLYVCGVEIVDHQCTDEDVASEADYIAINGSHKGHKWEIAPEDIPVLGTEGSDYKKTVQIHLNSFRFGTVMEVKYCYDFKRIPSASTLSHIGYLDGYISATLTDTDYIGIAKLSANLSYSCFDKQGIIVEGESGDDFLGPLSRDSVIKYQFPASVEFNIGTEAQGGCHFFATFTEGNIGQIRPLKPGTGTGSERLYSGQIHTNVHLEMLLESQGI